MATMVNLTIDGKQVQVAQGTNLIDAAETAGVHIPNLCYLKGLSGIGACRLCLVEVAGAKYPLIACNTKVKEGMVVTTQTEKINETRKFVIDLIVSMHPLDCMTCTKAGVCNLQNYAYDFQIKESSFTRKNFGFSVDDANPFIKRDPDYCVLCSRCVRVCKHQGTNVLEFLGRGVGSKVATVQDRPLQESGCTFCGSCVDVCPVNALLEADRWRKGREWDYDTTSSVCLLCGNGCDIAVSTQAGKVAKITAGGADGSVEKYLCAYGRFGFDSIEADTRVTQPLKRSGGGLQETTWEDALGIVAGRLKEAGAAAGFVSTADITNEDAIMLQRLAGAVGSKNVDTTASLYADTDSLKNPSGDLDSADLIILAGLDPNQWTRVLPALDAAIRRRVDSGAKLVVVNSGDTRISAAATLSLRGQEEQLLAEIAKGVVSSGGKAPAEMVKALASVEPSEGAAKSAELFVAANNPLILCSPALYDAAANLSLIKGAALAVPLESNAKGVVLMGITGAGKSYREMIDTGMSVLYATGALPVKERPRAEFLIVQNSHLTELAKQADIVLPSSAFLEVSGTIVDYLGKIKRLGKAIEPVGSAKPHREIFLQVASALGKKIKEPGNEEIEGALQAVPKTTFKPFGKKEGFGVEPQELMESINSCVINGSRLLWLKESKVLA